MNGTWIEAVARLEPRSDRPRGARSGSASSPSEVHVFDARTGLAIDELG